ncbi:MAG: pyridoxal phosphate-dependent aminotransferase [Clostridiales bacterium]|jgi:cystathionine beta-lyase|nr:pyridoxal phosphate-dependent aminotransferase [Clostridiales bacterium]
MSYDFDTVIDRHGTNSLKWDFAVERKKPEGLLSMWVADMDFQALPEALEDMAKVISHGIFGYTEVKQDYYDVVKRWFDARFGFSFERQDVVKTPGVVFALALSVRAFTKAGDSVLIQTPVYYPFYEVIRDNGRKIVTSPLVYSNGVYTINFADFEQKIVDNNVKLFILCSPHNPVGRVWTYDELSRISEICKAHGVTVVSDEIHCDFVWGENRHTCFALLDKDAIVATAPSKTFNLAGLQVSNIIVKNPERRLKIKAEIDKTGYSQVGTLGLVACQSAYAKGEAWLDELKAYIEGNISFIKDFRAKNLPKITLVEPQGTYLLWLDFSAYGLSQSELDTRVISGANLWLDSGTMFGVEGTNFQRVNIACPRSVLADALNRLAHEFADNKKI